MCRNREDLMFLKRVPAMKRHAQAWLQGLAATFVPVGSVEDFWDFWLFVRFRPIVLSATKAQSRSQKFCYLPPFDPVRIQGLSLTTANLLNRVTVGSAHLGWSRAKEAVSRAGSSQISSKLVANGTFFENWLLHLLHRRFVEAPHTNTPNYYETTSALY